MKNQLHLTLFFVLITCISFAQECGILMRPVSMEDRIAESTIIVEGEIIKSESYWDLGKSNIYTIHTVDVYKNLKGTLHSSIKVATMGGSIDGEIQITTGTAKLGYKTYGTFILKPSRAHFTSVTDTYELVASAQGFIRYNTYEDKASDVFNIYESIEEDLYPKFSKILHKSFTIVKSKTAKSATSKSVLATPTITGISPTSVSAGTDDVITITGTNFGATMGSVGFRNADDGGATFFNALDSQIVSWTDTEIQVQVPSDAGTGNILITNADPAQAQSSQTISVRFNHVNVNSGGNTLKSYLVADNGNGGFTFEYHTDFDTSSAKPYFEEAFDLWNCETGINFIFGAVGTTDVSNRDGINVVRFDNGAELDTGILGRVTTRFYASCPDESALVNELDITWDDGTNWYYGNGTPSGSQYDFKSVALHELGHAHQLSHIIDNNTVMHFGIGPGVSKYALNANDLEGANYVKDLIETGTLCTSEPAMTENYMCCSGLAFTSNPSDATVCEGTGTGFNVTADFVDTYQWQVNSGSSWSDVSASATYSGVDSASLTINNPDFGLNSNSYRCVITNTCGDELTSNTATLTVDENPSATVATTNTSCDNTTLGKLTFSFPDNSARTNIEFSINNGTSYDYNFSDNAGSGEVASLSAGDYDVWVLWGDDTCPIDLGTFTIGTDADDINPIANCKNATIQLDASGNATLTASDIDDGSSDTCGSVTLSVSKTTFSCSDIGDNTVTLTVEDENSNTETCTATVTVEDNIAPSISANSSFTLDLDNDGEATLQVSDIDTGSSDNCGIASSVLSNTSFNGSDLGDSSQTLTLEDASGNSIVHNFTLTVRDLIAPVITLNGNAVITIELGDSYTELNATATDNVDGDLTADVEILDNIDLTKVGSYTVRYGVEDSSGNFAIELTRTVNVVDTATPIITLTGNNPQTIELGDGYTELGATTDDGTTVTIDTTDFIDAVGSYTVYYDATDASGNNATQVTRTVNVIDTTAPVITLTGANPQTIEQGDGYTELGATTDDGSTVSIDTSEFMDAVGSYTIYYDATDASGNNAVQVTRIVNVEARTLSDQNFEFDEILLYPNPTSGIVNILNYQEVISIQVINYLGKVISEQKSSLNEIDLSRFDSGVYILRITSNYGNKAIRLVKN